jgi:hypothetical protein
MVGWLHSWLTPLFRDCAERYGRGWKLKLVEDYPAPVSLALELHFPRCCVLDLSLLLADITIGLLHDEIVLHIHDLTTYTPYHKDIIVYMDQDILIA